MPSWMPAFNVPYTDPDWWLWLGWSVLPDVILFTNVVWLWRSLVRARAAAQRQEDAARRDLARQTEILGWATALAEVGIWFWDLATGQVEWSDRAKAQFALPPGRTPSLDYFFSVMHPEDRDRVRAAIDRSLADRQHYRTVFRVVHPDGTQRWLAAMGRGRYAEEGRPISMGGVTIDVTGLRTIEDELHALKVITKQQAEELELARRFRLFAENASDVVMETDAGDVIRWITPSVSLRIGREAKELIGERFARLVHPDERDRLRALESQVTQGVLGWKPADWIGRDGRDVLATTETLDQYDRKQTQVLAGQGIVSRTQIRSAAGGVHWVEVHAYPYRTGEGVVSGAVASLRVVDAEVRMEQALERRARVDELTGLLNRTEFLERLGLLVARGERGVAVLWCDIDGFKAINDAHGHAAGDAVLEALGARIRGCLPSADDISGRIGGDELMVALPGVQESGVAARTAEDLRRRAAEPIAFPGGTVAATLSIGVAIARPHESVDALLARADDAMYEAKKRGRNQIVAATEGAAMTAT